MNNPINPFNNAHPHSTNKRASNTRYHEPRKGTRSERSLDAREFVMHADEQRLQAEGAGELMRLSKIISLNNDPHTQLTSTYRSRIFATTTMSEAMPTNPSTNLSKKMLIEQDTVLESKLQKAFICAITSLTVNPGAKCLDVILIKKHSPLGEQVKLLHEHEKLQAYDYIANDQGRALADLTKDELLFIAEQLKPTDQLSSFVQNARRRNAAFTHLAHALNTTQQTSLTRRTQKSLQAITPQNPSAIQHRTTLIALINKRLIDLIVNYTQHLPSTDQQLHLQPIYELCMRAAHNHVTPTQLKEEILSYLIHAIISPSGQFNTEVIDNADMVISNAIDHFHPATNLGAKMESPHAKKMENLFAAAVIEQPTASMRLLTQKIMAQLKNFAYFDALLQNYANQNTRSVYKIAQKKDLTNTAIIQAIETGSNLALFIDFHHVCCNFIQHLKFVKEINNGEIFHTWYEKTYIELITVLRGDRVPLPRLTSIKDAHTRIGIGHHHDAIALDCIKVPFTRPSTIKTSFGYHASLAAEADAAQACGISGCANVHLWGQSIINQQASDDLKMSQTDTQLFILMISAVLTADGGHSLNETLKAAQLASRSANKMSESSKNQVSQLFGHVHAITSIMDNYMTEFRHYDMVFASLNDPEIDNILDSAWKKIVALIGSGF